MTTGLWIAVIVIGAVTYLSRALPFLIRFTGKASPTTKTRLAALGPCLLAGMAAAAFSGEFHAALSSGKMIPLVAGTVLAIVSMGVKRDPGIAAIAGVVGWWLATMVV